MYKFLLCILISYFLGNVSGGLIFGKLFFHKDIRNYGSKNAGTTNAMRVFGFKAGALTFIVDFFKAVVACYIGFLILGEQGVLISGIFVVLGHNWPVFLNFKGGKGIASSFGFIVFFNYKIGLICMVIFICIAYFTRYVSLSSMVSVASTLPIFYFFGYRNIEIFLTLLLLSILSIYRHRSNIKRLISGNENKISFKNK